jgi:alpha-ketoglutarate-dependent taurine dioxygenase
MFFRAGLTSFNRFFDIREKVGPNWIFLYQVINVRPSLGQIGLLVNSATSKHVPGHCDNQSSAMALCLEK